MIPASACGQKDHVRCFSVVLVQVFLFDVPKWKGTWTVVFHGKLGLAFGINILATRHLLEDRPSLP